MREAFAKIMETKGFQRQAKMRWPILTTPYSGEDWEKVVISVLATPKENFVTLMEMVEKHVQ